MKVNRVKLGRKVCLSKDNKAEVHEIVDIFDGKLVLICVNTGVLVRFGADGQPLTVKDMVEVTPQQLENHKNACKSKKIMF